MSEEGKVVLAIRLRGQVRVRPQIDTTLDKLLLLKLHHARLIKLTPSLQGMVTKVKDYITWGELDADTATLLLTKRGRLTGNKRLTDEYIKKNSPYKTIKAFAKALVDGKGDISEVEELKPIFRLHPPKKGFKGKRNLPVGMGGVNGYRGTGINELVKRMV